VCFTGGSDKLLGFLNGEHKFRFALGDNGQLRLRQEDIHIHASLRIKTIFHVLRYKNSLGKNRECLKRVQLNFQANAEHRDKRNIHTHHICVLRMVFSASNQMRGN